MKLKREPGAYGKGVVLMNVKYLNAASNFELYRFNRAPRRSRSTKGPMESA